MYYILWPSCYMHCFFTGLYITCISKGKLVNAVEQIALKYQGLRTAVIYFWLTLCGQQNTMSTLASTTSKTVKKLWQLVHWFVKASAWKRHASLLLTFYWPSKLLTSSVPRKEQEYY